MDIFNARAEDYDAWYEKYRFAHLSELEALRRLVPRGGHGLEVGVGTGRFAQPLRVKVGLDPAPNMLRMAAERGVKTVRGRGESLPFADGGFDYVLIAITLCFVRESEAVIAECERVLRRGGRVIIGIVDAASWLGKLYKEKKEKGQGFYPGASFFSGREVEDLLCRHSFGNIVAYQTLFSPLEKLEGIDSVEPGHGRGGFTAIAGEKTL